MWSALFVDATLPTYDIGCQYGRQDIAVAQMDGEAIERFWSDMNAVKGVPAESPGGEVVEKC